MKIKFLLIAAALLMCSQSAALAQLRTVTETGIASAQGGSWLAGVQGGYNWQRDAWVYGIVTDVSWMNPKSQASKTLPGFSAFSPFSTTTDFSADIHWYGTLRGRVGWASGPLLFYGTGGLAYGRLDLNNQLTGVDTSNARRSVVRTLSAASSFMRAGWVVGGGIEYMWRPNVVLNLEYQFVDLGMANIAADQTFNGGEFIVTSLTASQHGAFSVVKVGMSWLFGPAQGSAAANWKGGYIGAHGGYAKGNDTNASYFASDNFGI